MAEAKQHPRHQLGDPATTTPDETIARLTRRPGTAGSLAGCVA